MNPRTPTVDGRLLASLCHDLRGPLGAIGTWVHVLASGRADEATRTRALEAMGRAVREQSGLLEQLSELAALLEGEVEVPRARIELGALVRQVIGALPVPATVAFEGEEPGPTVEVEVERVRRMLATLVGPTVKGAGEERQVSVATAGGEAVVTLTALGAPRPWSVALVSALAQSQGGRLDVETGSGTAILRARLPLS